MCVCVCWGFSSLDKCNHNAMEMNPDLLHPLILQNSSSSSELLLLLLLLSLLLLLLRDPPLLQKSSEVYLLLILLLCPETSSYLSSEIFFRSPVPSELLVASEAQLGFGESWDVCNHNAMK